MKRFLLLFTLLLVAFVSFAQMDMLPEIFRDLPPELKLGLPTDMTFEHYRQMTRNVDFFTMFMSMWVPGYGLYQVERPALATVVLSGRVAASGLMAAAIVRQWADFRDLAGLREISEEKYRSFLVNATLFGSGVFLNGMGWALDVLGAYHIAKAEKDYALYKYGLITNVDGTNEERLRAYLHRTLVQNDDALRLGDDLERYLRAFPDGAAAPEMAFHLGTLRAQQDDDREAFAYLARSIFAYPEHDFTRAAEQALAGLVHDNREAWASDWAALWSLVDLRASMSEEVPERYYQFLTRLGELQSETFREAYLNEAGYYLWRFPDSEHEAELLYLLGERAIELERGERAVSAFASVIYVYPRSGFYFRSVATLGSYYDRTLDESERAMRIYAFADRASADGLPRAEETARSESLSRFDELAASPD